MSYEKKVSGEYQSKKELPEKLDIGIIKYFWQASPFAIVRKDVVPKFLRRIPVLKNFTDNELRKLSTYLHHRRFDNGEIIFNQGELGVGFYFIFSGHVDVESSNDHATELGESVNNSSSHVLSLERRDYFGELALLQDNNVRTATVIAKNSCEVLGIFRPDLDGLINEYPIVATKLLQSISLIVADRLFSVTKEVGRLKYKILTMENGLNENK